MDRPSPSDGPEAYVPREPEEDDWPPGSREIAMERARQVRLEEGGLPVDDATLERVADAAMDPGYPVPGLYYTAEELADEARVDDAPGGAFAPVDAYLRRYPEIDGGTWLGWRDGRRFRFVGLVGDAESHKPRLSQLGGERVAFERVPRTVRELAATADRLVADRDVLRAAGYELLGVGSDQRLGVVEVQIVGGADAAAAEGYFAERYGDAVAVDWLGPSRLREVPHPFGSWTSEDRRLRLFFGLDHNGQRRGEARVVEESDERIVIALSRLQPVGATTLVGGFQPDHVDVELHAPVGDRAIIDASAGVPRPSLAQLRDPSG